MDQQPEEQHGRTELELELAGGGQAGIGLHGPDYTTRQPALLSHTLQYHRQHVTTRIII